MRVRWQFSNNFNNEEAGGCSRQSIRAMRSDWVWGRHRTKAGHRKWFLLLLLLERASTTNTSVQNPPEGNGAGKHSDGAVVFSQVSPTVSFSWSHVTCSFIQTQSGGPANSAKNMWGELHLLSVLVQPLMMVMKSSRIASIMATLLPAILWAASISHEERNIYIYTKLHILSAKV